MKCTLPETNIGPENQWLKDEFSFGDGPFSGAFAVSFREGKHWLFDLGKYFGQVWNNQNQCVKW